MTAAVWKMRGMPLSRLLDGFVTVSAAEERTVTRLTLDSGTAGSGALFCALRGTRIHGLEFAAEAAERGAAAVLAEPSPHWTFERIATLRGQLGVPVIEVPDLGQRLSAIAGRFFGDPSRGLDLVAVTGTNGKTSVCQFTARALGARARCGVVGTLGYGFPGELTETGYTTPDAIRMQAVLAELKQRGAAVVAMEVSSHALDQGRAAALHTDTAVFTNLTRDHLDYHGDMLDYGKAKQRLFHAPGLKHAVLNADDPFGLEILASLDPAVQPVLYGLTQAAEETRAGVRWLRATEIEHRARGMRIHFTGSWGPGTLESSLLGDFNAANLLAVLAVMMLSGRGLQEAVEVLGTVRGVPGRMECFGDPGQPLVVVDYAHTPDALEQALRVLRAHDPRHLVCLFGCGGDRDRGKRPLMGEVAERLADRVVLTDDNPRGENGDTIIEQIQGGMQVPENAEVVRDRAAAIRRAIGVAGPQDIVLVAGKGHETYQLSGGRVLPFSDREQVARALAGEGAES